MIYDALYGIIPLTPNTIVPKYMRLCMVLKLLRVTEGQVWSENKQLICVVANRHTYLEEHFEQALFFGACLVVQRPGCGF